MSDVVKLLRFSEPSHVSALRGAAQSRTGAGAHLKPRSRRFLAVLGGWAVLAGLWAFALARLTGEVDVRMAAFSAAAFGLAPLVVLGFQDRSFARQGAIVCAGAAAMAIALLTGGWSSPFLIWLAAPSILAVLGDAPGERFTGLAVSAIGMAALMGAGAPGPEGAAASAGLIAVLAFTALAPFASGRMRAGGDVKELRRKDGRTEAADAAPATPNESDLGVLRLGLGLGEGDFAIRHDGAGRILFATPEIEAVIGQSAGELIGRRLSEFVNADDAEDLKLALEGGCAMQAQRRLVFRITGPEGRQIWLEMTRRALRSTRYPFVQRTGALDWVSVFRDVTAIQEDKRRLESERAAAVAANEAKSRFLANMSHELRTPLNAVIGFSDMMRAETFGPLGSPKYREYADLIHESGSHLLDLINDVLDMSKIEAEKYELYLQPVNMAQTIDACMRLMRLAAETAGISLQANVAAGLPPIEADARAVKQILLNILSNAIKFTPAGGEVVLTARIEAGQMAVNVRDTGVGIAAADLDRVGRPFSQLDNAPKSSDGRQVRGTGLGLALVKSLAGLHGGRADISSEPGVGTEVKVSLPLRGPQTDSRATGENLGAALRLVAQDGDASAPPVVHSQIKRVKGLQAEIFDRQLGAA